MAGASPVLASLDPSGWAGLGWTILLHGLRGSTILSSTVAVALSIGHCLGFKKVQQRWWPWSPHALLFPPLCQFSRVLPDSFISLHSFPLIPAPWAFDPATPRQ